jgi:hypothetical protein
MVKLDRIEHIVTIPEGVSASISEDGVVHIQGPKGSLSREFISTFIDLSQKDSKDLVICVDMPRRKQRALAGTWNAHLKNMVKGVTDGFTYNLKAFYSHFPMTLAVKGNIFVVSVFLETQIFYLVLLSKSATRSKLLFLVLTRNLSAKQLRTSKSALQSKTEIAVYSKMEYTSSIRSDMNGRRL